jgi:hypothetical protein
MRRRRSATAAAGTHDLVLPWRETRTACSRHKQRTIVGRTFAARARRSGPRRRRRARSARRRGLSAAGNSIARASHGKLQPRAHLHEWFCGRNLLLASRCRGYLSEHPVRIRAKHADSSRADAHSTKLAPVNPLSGLPGYAELLPPERAGSGNLLYAGSDNPSACR